jgi:hypothetical protein
LKNSWSGRKSLKKYEITNLLFFLVLIVALGVLVAFVFRYYGTRNSEPAVESETGVVSDSCGDASDVGMFYLGATIVQTSHQFKSRLEVPVTDDGLLKELFDLPGVEEITLDQRIIVVRKSSSTRWEGIQAGVRRIVKSHLHIHY